ncbi:MAG: CBS domain-containing protein [Thaumarchaeota archaeon S15]|nr:MAG: CBS domain-containing protein [Thaumarchaeota archaeon S15]
MAEIREGLTFDDVLLVPKYSDIASRSQVSLRTRISRNIEASLPLISANMDTVTEHAMAVTMAREGGIGIVHRFLGMREQADEILKVKRSGSVMVENPYTISPDQSIADALAYERDMGVSGLLVTEGDSRRLVGVITERDIVFAPDRGARVRDVMTTDLVTGSAGIGLEEAKRILHDNRIEKLPLVDAEGRVTGLVTSTDILDAEAYPDASKDKKGRPLVGAAVGVKDDYMDRAEALLGAGADVIVVDIAHGHSENALSAVRSLRRAFGDAEIIAGGRRDVAGDDLGVAKHGIPVISDGGTRTSGDVTKALAAGASAVMLGGMLGGTDESPGTVITKDSKRFKVYRGMASLAASMGRRAKEGRVEDDINDYVAEGVEALVPYRGSVREILAQLSGGVRSGLSYCGAHDIAQLQRNAEFVRMSRAGFAESQPHDVAVV